MDDAKAARMTWLAGIVDMGQRALDGRGPQWRNWTRIFAIRLLTNLGSHTDMPADITVMESIEMSGAFGAL